MAPPLPRCRGVTRSGHLTFPSDMPMPMPARPADLAKSISPGATRPLVRAALVTGIFSGAPSTLHALVTGGDLLAATRAAGTLLPGRRERPGIIAGAVAHVALTAWWVGVLALVTRRRRLGPWRGALAGAAIAGLDLGVIAPRRAPAIAALPQGPQWADHLAFGALAGAQLWGVR